MPASTSLAHVPSLPLRPFAFVGRVIYDVVHYLGGFGLLGFSAVRSIVRPRGDAPPLAPAVARHLDRIFRFGLLAWWRLIHVGLGSFLAMQAYFGATFLDGIGPVVGVGMVRNIGPLMAAMALSGLLAAACIPPSFAAPTATPSTRTRAGSPTATSWNTGANRPRDRPSGRRGWRPRG